MSVPVERVEPIELWRRAGEPRRAVAVVAHPDDESFGLGGVLGVLVDAGTSVGVVCLTRGEASSLGAAVDLGVQRDGELRAAAAVLGVEDLVVFDYADGLLAEAELHGLCAAVRRRIGPVDLVVAFEPGGVTGHPDHRAATAVARCLADDRRVPLLEWGVSPGVASALRGELGAPFVALEDEPGAAVIEVVVDRRRQLEAIACHQSQASDNAVLARRLALQGPLEHLRLRVPTDRRTADGAPVVDGEVRGGVAASGGEPGEDSP